MIEKNGNWITFLTTEEDILLNWITFSTTEEDILCSKLRKIFNNYINETIT